MAIVVTEKSTTPKMSKSQKYDILLGIVNGGTPSDEQRAMLVEFIDHEKELLVKKKSSGTLSDKQKESMRLSAEVFAIVDAATAPMTIDDIKAQNAEFEGRNPQFMTALLTPLLKAETVERIVIKKKAHYAIKGRFTTSIEGD